MAPQSPISAPPWTVLGHRKDGRPIRPLAGGAEDTDPAPEPDPAGPEPAADPDDDWAPPTREEWEAHQERLRAASAEAATRRKYLRANGIDPKTGQKAQPDPDPEPAVSAPKDPAAPPGLTEADVKRAVDRAVAETQLKGTRQMRTFTVGFNAALADAGWNGSRLGSLMKLLDLDGIDIDDDGEVTGLSEQIGEIKEEFPELFKRQRSVTSSPGAGSGQNGAPAAKVDTADKPAPKPAPKDWAEQLAQRALRS